MQIATIIAELEAAAQQEAAGIHVLETTRFEPELGAVAGSCLTAAKRRAEALGEAVRLLRIGSQPQAFITMPGQVVYLDAPPRSASLWRRLKTWMLGSSPSMTAGRRA